MKTTKAVALQIPEVGMVTFKRSRRARHLRIRIKPFAGVCVSVPVGVSLSAAQDFVQRHKKWIAKHLQKIREAEKQAVVYDGRGELRTRRHKLDARAAEVGAIHVQLAKGVVRVRYPRKLPLRHPRVQSAIQRGLIAAYRIEAQGYLPERLRWLAQLHGFSFNRVFIKNHKSRWGSCSSRNNINLSLHLMRLPDHLVDYVLLHELAHTRVPNHSADFWKLLESVYPNAKAANKELRKFAQQM